MLQHFGLGLKQGLRQARPFANPAVTSLIAKRSINILPWVKQIPQPPGNIVGTVNDAYVPPPPDKGHGSRHWTFERLVGVGLVPLTVAPYVFGSMTPLADSLLSVLLLVHCHTGFQSCIIDYIPKRLYGWVHDFFMYLLSFGSGMSLYGIYLMESHDIGLTSIFLKLWY